MAQTGVAAPYRLPVLAAASLPDVGFAFACVSRLRRRAALWLLQCVTVSAYSLLVAFRLPEMWLHPFAPLVKNVPIPALLFFLYQMNREAES